MRLLFTLTAILICMVCFGQKYRHHKDSSALYLVQYNIDELGEIMVPAVGYYDEDGKTTAGGQEHYSAWITVYRLQKKDTVIIGKPFRGQYIEGGCFEDRPEDMVNHAKLLQSEMKKPKR